MYPISYFCKNFVALEVMRELYFSDEFWTFYNNLSNKVQHKFDYVFGIVKTEKIISTKFVKHLENTDLYEMRVSIDKNEYRTILFAIDDRNIIISSKIFVLNAFVKKSTKDYKRQISKAINILNGLEYDEDR